MEKEHIDTRSLENNVTEIASSALGHFWAEIDANIQLHGDYEWWKADYLRHELDKSLRQAIKEEFAEYERMVDLYNKW